MIEDDDFDSTAEQSDHETDISQPSQPSQQLNDNNYNLSGNFQRGITNIGSKLENVTQNIITKVNRQRVCPTPPSDPDHFGGRKKSLAELKNRLKTGRASAITVILGMGGIG
ncbi:MAG TPA: hypothetical protein VEP90_00365, partial [Methylomirabilota bacterium]|nr:hypothetical protein [Methylomirabilota bacterium]